ncbi:hypothetical protein DL98DRAFT_598903 [Cadophora sp. DSE1049]|nr:hypothetical protein DL98DRAFT_598903 [Cadophora sp. DSE1049]
MAPIKNVAIVGRTGYLGKCPTAALASSEYFNVTLISRSNDFSTAPAGVKTLVVDSANSEALVSAFKGQCCRLSNSRTLHRSPIPASQLSHCSWRAPFRPVRVRIGQSQCSGQKMDFFQIKVIVDQAVFKAADEGKITYTSIVGGDFVEWMLTDEYVMPVKRRKFFIQGDGNSLIDIRIST